MVPLDISYRYPTVAGPILRLVDILGDEDDHSDIRSATLSRENKKHDIDTMKYMLLAL